LDDTGEHDFCVQVEECAIFDEADSAIGGRCCPSPVRVRFVFETILPLIPHMGDP
jgi:hypothetical protein